MRTLMITLLLASWALPALAQTVTIRATAISQSEKQIVLRLRSGDTLTLPMTDVVDTTSTPSVGPQTETPQRSESDSTNQLAIFPYDVRTQCAADWPTEPNMLASCEKGQQEALAALRSRSMPGHEQQAIRNHCTTQWPQNYRLRNACEEDELRALRALRTTPDQVQKR
jgi:hypothetical protein